jgi:hypothetical protein
VDLKLALPIGPLLKRAKQVLRKPQADFKRQHPDLMVRKRARSDNYRTYLQLLDADEAGASHDDMAALYPHIPNDPPDYTGREKVRDALAAAKRLRDGDYRYLLLQPPTGNMPAPLFRLDRAPYRTQYCPAHGRSTPRASP